MIDTQLELFTFEQQRELEEACENIQALARQLLNAQKVISAQLQTISDLQTQVRILTKSQTFSEAHYVLPIGRLA